MRRYKIRTFVVSDGNPWLALLIYHICHFLSQTFNGKIIPLFVGIEFDHNVDLK